MQTTFTNSMLAHVWAQQSQDAGNNHGYFMYFKGPTIYSFGSHFPMASFAKPELVLVNNATYSSRTSGQQCHVRRAIPSNVKTIYVIDCLANKSKSAHNVNLSGLKADMLKSVLLASRARVYIANHLDSAESSRTAYNDYLIAFKIKRKLITELPDSKAIKLKADKSRKKELALARKIEAKMIKESKIKLVEWMDGGPTFLNMRMLPVSLRIAGENIETTQGASFPIDHAIKAYRVIRALRGKTWARNGGEIRLGYFHIDSINSAGDIIAGCHRVPGIEVTRMGEILLNR